MECQCHKIAAKLLSRCNWTPRLCHYVTRKLSPGLCNIHFLQYWTILHRLCKSMHNACVSPTVCESWEPCTCVSHFKFFLWICNQHVDTYQWATIYIGLIHMVLIIYTLPSAYPHIHTHYVKYCWWARWLDIHNRQVLGRNATRKMDTCHHWPPTQ